jgi:hypothetical protein
MNHISFEDFSQKTGKYFPEEALAYAYSLFVAGEFSLKITPARISKKGDFRYHLKGTRLPQITVNGDLCPYDFLIVYLHEFAHYQLYKTGNIQREAAHGKGWQTLFSALLHDLLSQVILPGDIAAAFQHHAQHIKSSTCTDSFLEKTLERYRKRPEGVSLLKNLAVGTCFICRGTIFHLDEFARTRARCTCVKNGKKYLISMLMPVKTVSVG